VKRYRLLLRLFPRAWRERYGEEVLRVVAEDNRNAGLGTSLGLVKSGLVERARQFQHLIWSGVRFSRGRAIALGAGLMVAAVGFSLLTAAVDVGIAKITGVVSSNWRGAYDILVLPAGSGRSALTPGHPVQANYLSAGTGGITLAQYQQMSRLPGVGVAAPLEIVGYVLETVSVPVAINPVASGSGAAVFTVTSTVSADNGLSKYPPVLEGYVYVTPNALSGLQIDQARQLIGPVEQLPQGARVTVCPTDLSSQPQQPSPFRAAADVLSGSCDSRSSGTPIDGYVTWSFPVLVAGVDPRAENDLGDLSRAVTSGHYLDESSGPTSKNNFTSIPVIASTVSFDSDVDRVTIARLPASAISVARSQDPAAIAADFETAKAAPVLHTTVTATEAWQGLLQGLAEGALVKSGNGSGPIVRQALGTLVGQYWTAGSVSLRSGPEGAEDAVPVANPASVWQSGTRIVGEQYVSAPPAAADTAFRSLTEHVNLSGNGQFSLLQVGEFDPYRLAGFSGGASPLATYRAPNLSGANAASRAALGGASLLPSGNMAGYTQEPPLFLTTLSGAQALENPTAFSNTSDLAAAPIGSIRVRVADLRGSVSEQLGKIAAIAQEIHQATGLRVVVTAGASPQAVTIALPAGRFGRPPLQLTEDWTAVMVATVILHQADAESVALFVLILLVSGLFLTSAALSSVRGRREEIAVLRAIGWGRSQVFGLVLGEVATLGAAAGVVGAGFSVVLIEALHLGTPLWRALLVLPVAVALSILAGLAPAALAARTEPSRGLRPSVRAPHRRGKSVRTVTGMALVGLTRTPGRAAVAAGALAVGVAGLAVLLAAEASFRQSIGDSVLAGLVTSSSRGADLASAVLAVGLGAASVADVTYLNLRERAAELAALAATGWGRRDLTRLLATESIAVAVLGSALGAAVGLIAASYAFGLSALVVVGALGAMGTGAAAALLGTGAVLAVTGGRSLTPALARDE
jgi:putative ABC transport system permease protein